MKNKPANFPSALSRRAVPLGFNLPSNCYSAFIDCHNDFSTVRCWFYEYHGMYWYSIFLSGAFSMNSVPYLSIQNCISAFRSFLREYGFAFNDVTLAENELSDICLLSKSHVSLCKAPKSWKV